jgi:HSP20 family protein
MDVTEGDNEYVLKADLPGLSESDVNVELDDNVLRISGERKSEHEQRTEGYYRVERASGRFSRALTLPEGVTADSIKATFDNGVLEVHIQKPEQQKPQKVAIAVGHEPKTIETAEDTESSQAA